MSRSRVSRCTGKGARLTGWLRTHALAMVASSRALNRGHSGRNWALGMAVLAAALFGVATPLSKALLEVLEPQLLAGLFYLGAALAMLPPVLATERNSGGETGGDRFAWPRDVASRRSLLGAILFGGVLGPLLLLFGLSLAKAGSVAMLLNLETVATAVLGLLLFREHLGRWTWVANAGVFASGLLLSIDGGRPGLLGALLVAAAALCWGFDNQFTARIDGITPAQSTFWKGLVAGAVNVGIGLVLVFLAAPSTSAAFEGLGAISPGMWFGALLVGTLSYGVSIQLYISSAQRVGATRAQMAFATAPIFGVLGAMLWLGEAFSLLQGGAALLLCVSIALLFLDSHAHEHVHGLTNHTHSHTHGGRENDGHHDHDHPELEAVPAGTRHCHHHKHQPVQHEHAHWPDLHHRHQHGAGSTRDLT